MATLRLTSKATNASVLFKGRINKLFINFFKSKRNDKIWKGINFGKGLLHPFVQLTLVLCGSCRSLCKFGVFSMNHKIGKINGQSERLTYIIVITLFP